MSVEIGIYLITGLLVMTKIIVSEDYQEFLYQRLGSRSIATILLILILATTTIVCIWPYVVASALRSD